MRSSTSSGVSRYVLFTSMTPDRHVLLRSDGGDQLELGELTAGHLQMELVDGEPEERREHRRIAPLRRRASLVVAEAQVGAEVAAADDGLDRAVEQIDEPGGVLPVRVAAHRGLVDGDDRAAGSHEANELRLDRADECLGHRPPIGVCARRDDATRECVRAWDRSLQHGACGCELTEPLEVLDDAEAARGTELADDAVTPTLVVGGRTEIAAVVAPRARAPRGARRTTG